MGVELVLFLAVGGVAVLAAIGMLLSENAVHSALFLILNFFCVAFFFLMLDAPFISMVQIAVYTGAIMVLFLFVIMLLGAEKTTDTTRRFRWVTGTGTLAALALLGLIGFPLALGQFQLPEAKGADPQVRVIHAVTDVPAVNISLAGGETQVALEDVNFTDVTDYLSVPPGDYTLTIALPEGDIPIHSEALTVEAGQMLSVTAYGAFRGGTFGVAAIANSDEPSGEKQARLIAFNAFSEDAVSLVDLGPNRELDTIIREVEVDGEMVAQTFIADTVLAADMTYGSEPVVTSYDEGDYTLAFVSSDLETVVTLPEFHVVGDSEAMVLLVAEPLFDESLRPKVLDVDGDDVSDGIDAVTKPVFGSPAGVGVMLFTDYVLPVQLVGLLLLVALIGVVVLTRPEGERRERRPARRRKVSRPLVNVISQQTGSDISDADLPTLSPPGPASSGD